RLAGRLEISFKRVPNAPRSLRRQERAIWFEVRVVGGRHDQDRNRSHPYCIRDERLQTAAEVAQERCKLAGSVDRHVDQSPAARWRRDRDATFLGGLPDQAAKRRNALDPVHQETPSGATMLVEIIVDDARGVEARRELVVTAIDNQQVRTPRLLDQLSMLGFQ